MIVLTAVLVGLVAGVNFNFDARGKEGYFGVWVFQTLIWSLIAGVWLYFGTPALTGPFYGLTWFILVAWTINSFFAGIIRESIPLGVLGIILFVVLAGFRGIAGTSMFTAESKQSLIGSVDQRAWNKDMEPVKDSHIRMVSQEQAAWAGNKVLGDSKDAIALGSRFIPGAYSIQRVNGKLYWVASMEYRAFRHWQSSIGTPGYLMVSAEDPIKPAEFVTEIGGKKLALRFTPSAFFGENLERHLYLNGFMNVRLEDIHFELNDEGVPFWVVSLVEPKVHYSNPEVIGIAIVDPQTGKIDRYGRDEIPAWVDRVIPEHIAEQYITWWGHLKDGWWNSFWAKDSVFEPTADDLRLVWGDDGEPYWFTGIASSSYDDDSLVGFVMTNSRTGATRQYRLSGSTEKGVMEAVNKQVSNYDGWHSTSPVLYNINGQLSWVSPVVTTEGIFKTIAIVRADNMQVALGTSKFEALREYQKLFAGARDVTVSSMAREKSVTLTVDRVQSDVSGKQYIFWSKMHPKMVFLGETATSLEIPLTREGDSVTIGYVETMEAAVTIVAFDNLTLPIGVQTERKAEK